MAIHVQGEGCDCKCLHCQPGSFPPEMTIDRHRLRVLPGHRAMRFGRFIDLMSTPFLGDQQVPDVIEGVSGEDGWLVVYSKDANGHLHMCRQCGNHLCLSVLRGPVAWKVPAKSEAAYAR